jgi:hypothetical protein
MAFIHADNCSARDLLTYSKLELQSRWTCPVSVDSFSSLLFVSGLTSSILHRTAVSRRRRQKFRPSDLQ